MAGHIYELQQARIFYTPASNRVRHAIIDFNEVDMRIYLHEKVIFTEATRPR